LARGGCGPASPTPPPSPRLWTPRAAAPSRTARGHQRGEVVGPPVALAAEAPQPWPGSSGHGTNVRPSYRRAANGFLPWLLLLVEQVVSSDEFCSRKRSVSSEESNPAMDLPGRKGSPARKQLTPNAPLQRATKQHVPLLTGSRRSSRAPSKRCQPAPADRAVIAICHPSASSRARSVRAHARRAGSTTGPRARKQARGTRRTYAVPNLRISCFAGISLPQPTLIRHSHGGARLIIGRSQPQPRQR
jgi:hypothetical protein